MFVWVSCLKAPSARSNLFESPSFCLNLKYVLLIYCILYVLYMSHEGGVVIFVMIMRQRLWKETCSVSNGMRLCCGGISSRGHKNTVKYEYFWVRKKKKGQYKLFKLLHINYLHQIVRGKAIKQQQQKHSYSTSKQWTRRNHWLTFVMWKCRTWPGRIYKETQLSE